MKKILLFFAFLFAFFASASFAFAADLNIDCPAPPTACSKTGADPLFSSATDGYWYPGRILTKTINFKNSGPETREMAIKGARTSGVSILENVMHISIVGGTTVIWSGSVADFYGQEKIGMGIFAPGADFDYDFTVSMSSGADDNYQNRETVFDLILGFWGEPIPTPTPTTTPVPTPTSAPGAVLGAGVSAPVCTDAKPGIPTGFTAIAGPGAGEVTLSWIPPALPYTYFLIAYSDSPSWPPKWGNPNVSNVTSYTVSGLGSGTYWFWLRAGNGCMPGDFTGPISPGAIAGVTAGGVAPGFLPGVLGEKTPGEITEAQSTKAGEVAGVEEKPKATYHWWLILPILVGGLFGGAYLYRRFFPKK
ncbi:MAG: fibronectin type III domain-containing protein [Microgenomates group bacterium]